MSRAGFSILSIFFISLVLIQSFQAHYRGSHVGHFRRRGGCVGVGPVLNVGFGYSTFDCGGCNRPFSDYCYDCRYDHRGYCHGCYSRGSSIAPFLGGAVLGGIFGAALGSRN